jgi:hypothetical protein
METRDLLESADVSGNGAIITFADGRFAFYSAALLRSVFDKADELFGEDDDAVHDSTWKKVR